MPDDIESIDTPAFVVNEAVALRNIAAFQVHCDKFGLDLCLSPVELSHYILAKGVRKHGSKALF